MPQFLYWTDIETTGLDERGDHILEICIYKAPFLDPFNASPFFHAVVELPIAPVAMNNFVRDMHLKNGLITECATTRLTFAQAAGELCRRLATEPHELSDGKPVGLTIAGSSVHFDLRFLNAKIDWASFGVPGFHYRVYDVSAIKLMCQSMGMGKFKQALAHRAEDDVLESIAHAKECADWLKAFFNADAAKAPGIIVTPAASLVGPVAPPER